MGFPVYPLLYFSSFWSIFVKIYSLNRLGVQMVLFIPFRTMIAYLCGLVLLTTLFFGRIVNVRHYPDGCFAVGLISFLSLYTGLTPQKLSVSATDYRQSFEIQIRYSRFFKVEARIREQNYPKGYPVVLPVKPVTDLDSGNHLLF
jgi:hypothetical protein